MDLLILIECYVICILILTGIVAASFLFGIGYGIYRFILWLHNKRGQKEKIEILACERDSALKAWRAAEAEIEELRKALLVKSTEIEAEAIKEFAERLHKATCDYRDKREMPMLPYTGYALDYVDEKIDNLVKEMVGELK